jgi:hypothetical protein
MGVIFHTPTAVNASTGNWIALPALPAGVDPMRRIIIVCTNNATTRANADFYVGECTAGQATADASYTYSTARFDLGVANYSKLTARLAGAGSGTPVGYMYIVSYSATDDGPRGVS